MIAHLEELRIGGEVVTQGFFSSTGVGLNDEAERDAATAVINIDQ